MRKRAIFYTLEFNGEVVHDTTHDFKVILQKDHIRGKLPSYQHSSYDEPLICQDVREILPTWFPTLNRYFGSLLTVEDYLNKNGRQALEEKLAWLKSFIVVKWTINPNNQRHALWEGESASPADFSPSFAKCIKNIEKVLK